MLRFHFHDLRHTTATLLPAEESHAAVLPLAVGGPHGAPVVRNSAEADFRPDASEVIRESVRGVGEWALLDSNQGPIGYEPTALTAELRALLSFFSTVPASA